MERAPKGKACLPVPSIFMCYVSETTLPETNSSHLKIGGWKMNFLLGPSIFLGAFAVICREGINPKTGKFEKSSTQKSLWTSFTPLKFNSLPLKNGGWKTSLSYWVSVTFQGRTVKLRECNKPTEVPQFETQFLKGWGETLDCVLQGGILHLEMLWVQNVGKPWWNFDLKIRFLHRI